MADERRTAQRIRAYRPVRLHHATSPRIVETLTKDISSGGIRCLSSSLFPVAAEFNIELVLSMGNGPVSARGKTVWFQTIPQSEQFELGIAFTDIPFQDKRRLSAYLSTIAENQPSSVTA
jgi:hypothetical protein